MRRLILWFIGGSITVIILSAILLFTPKVVEAFATTVGQNPSFGTTPAEAIDYSLPATLMRVGGLLAVPMTVVLAVFFVPRFLRNRRRRRF